VAWRVLVFEVNEFMFEIRDWRSFLFFPACNSRNKQNSINNRNNNNSNSSSSSNNNNVTV
jgi:hypothetical protein